MIKPNLGARESAAKEAFEEAGVQGEMHRKLLGIYRHRKLGDVYTVQVFAMKVRKIYRKWDESDRERGWFPFKDAVRRANRNGLKRLMERLPRLVR